VRTRHAFEIQACSVNACRSLGVSGVIFDVATERRHLETHPDTKIKDGDRMATLRECFALNGARAILDYPELSGKLLRSRTSRVVADDL
jgi:hypothetical protein